MHNVRNVDLTLQVAQQGKLGKVAEIRRNDVVDWVAYVLAGGGAGGSGILPGVVILIPVIKKDSVFMERLNVLIGIVQRDRYGFGEGKVIQRQAVAVEGHQLETLIDRLKIAHRFARDRLRNKLDGGIAGHLLA